jgi:hypothetical protein
MFSLGFHISFSAEVYALIYFIWVEVVLVQIVGALLDVMGYFGELTKLSITAWVNAYTGFWSSCLLG